MVRQIGLADSRLAHLGQAIGWIRAHYNQPLRIDHLASLCAMSTRGFHRHFRDVTRMTPLQYQKHLRLHEARARLAAGPSNIASVGYAVGYDSPSQFSREYHRMYGVPPGHTQPAPEPRRRPAEPFSATRPSAAAGRDDQSVAGSGTPRPRSGLSRHAIAAGQALAGGSATHGREAQP
jgi:AraC-like DNA-binding protein